MLSESQKMTIKVAVCRARENGTEEEEIRKLSSGMNISEGAIRAYANFVLGPTKTVSQKAEASISESRPAKTGKGREEWPEEQIQNLIKLHSQGMGPSAIAKAFGCEAKRIQSKLYNLKKSGRIIQNPANPEPPVQENQTDPETETEPLPKVEGIPLQMEQSPLPEIISNPETEIQFRPAPIRIASEIMNLAGNVESRGFAVGKIQINEVAGWGCFAFDSPDGHYRVSFHRRKNK